MRSFLSCFVHAEQERGVSIQFSKDTISIYNENLLNTKLHRVIDEAYILLSKFLRITLRYK